MFPKVLTQIITADARKSRIIIYLSAFCDLSGSFIFFFYHYG